MNAEQLWDTTMNPEMRTLRRVTIDNGGEADRIFSMLMETKSLHEENSSKTMPFTPILILNFRISMAPLPQNLLILKNYNLNPQSGI